MRFTALAVAFVFTATSVTWTTPAFAAPADVTVPALSSIDKLSIPVEMGTLRRGDRIKEDGGSPAKGQPSSVILHPSSERFVVLIQDAHAVIDAQENISKILDHLGRTYGVRLIALEGAKGRLEPILLRTFPEPAVKRKILAGYERRAELSGPEMAAVLQETTGEFRGMEDWGLYEKNYSAYLRAQEKKGALLGSWNAFKQALDLERAKIYDPKLNEFEEARENFLAERASLVDLLIYLTSFQKLFKPASGYRELPGLIQSIGYEKSGKQEALVPLVCKIADEFKVKYLRGLGVKAEMNFYNRYQAFMTGQITAGQMLQFLVQMGSEYGKAVRLTSALKKLLGHAELLSEIKGSQLYDELQRFLPEVEASLIKDPAQRELAEKYQKLFLLKEMITLELTHEDLAKYQKEPDAYLGLLGDPAITQDLAPALEFYQAALERDQAFMGKIDAMMTDTNVKTAVVVAGGFHTQGLERILKEKGVAYAVVTPKIASLSGIENYAKVMKGDVSFKEYLKTTYFDGLMRHAAKSLTESLPIQDQARTLKTWRDNMIRELAQEGRITDAGKYLPYIDELLKNRGEAVSGSPKRSKEEILDIVRKELEKFKKDSFERIWKTFEFQLGTFTDGLKQLISKKELNNQTVTALLDRASQTKPSFLSPQKGLDRNAEGAVFELPMLPQGLTSSAETRQEFRSEVRENADEAETRIPEQTIGGVTQGRESLAQTEEKRLRDGVKKMREEGFWFGNRLGKSNDGLGLGLWDADSRIISALVWAFEDTHYRPSGGEVLLEILKAMNEILIEVGIRTRGDPARTYIANEGIALYRKIKGLQGREEILAGISQFLGEQLPKRKENQEPLEAGFKNKIQEIFKDLSLLPDSVKLTIDNDVLIDLGAPEVQKRLKGVLIVRQDQKIPTRYTDERLLKEAAERHQESKSGKFQIRTMVTVDGEIVFVKEKKDHSGFKQEAFLLDTVDYGLLTSVLENHPSFREILRQAIAQYERYLSGELYHNDVASSNFRVLATIYGGEVDVQLIPVDFEKRGSDARSEVRNEGHDTAFLHRREPQIEDSVSEVARALGLKSAPTPLTKTFGGIEQMRTKLLGVLKMHGVNEASRQRIKIVFDKVVASFQESRRATRVDTDHHRGEVAALYHDEQHSIEVALGTVEALIEFGITDPEVMEIAALAGLLHDAGAIENLGLKIFTNKDGSAVSFQIYPFHEVLGIGSELSNQMIRAMLAKGGADLKKVDDSVIKQTQEWIMHYPYRASVIMDAANVDAKTQEAVRALIEFTKFGDLTDPVEMEYEKPKVLEPNMKPELQWKNLSKLFEPFSEEIRGPLMKAGACLAVADLITASESFTDVPLDQRRPAKNYFQMIADLYWEGALGFYDKEPSPVLQAFAGTRGFFDDRIQPRLLGYAALLGEAIETQNGKLTEKGIRQLWKFKRHFSKSDNADVFLKFSGKIGEIYEKAQNHQPTQEDIKIARDIFAAFGFSQARQDLLLSEFDKASRSEVRGWGFLPKESELNDFGVHAVTLQLEPSSSGLGDVVLALRLARRLKEEAGIGTIRFFVKDPDDFKKLAQLGVGIHQDSLNKKSFSEGGIFYINASKLKKREREALENNSKVTIVSQVMIDGSPVKRNGRLDYDDFPVISTKSPVNIYLHEPDGPTVKTSSLKGTLVSVMSHEMGQLIGYGTPIYENGHAHLLLRTGFTEGSVLLNPAKTAAAPLLGKEKIREAINAQAKGSLDFIPEGATVRDWGVVYYSSPKDFIDYYVGPLLEALKAGKIDPENIALFDTTYEAGYGFSKAWKDFPFTRVFYDPESGKTGTIKGTRYPQVTVFHVGNIQDPSAYESLLNVATLPRMVRGDAGHFEAISSDQLYIHVQPNYKLDVRKSMIQYAMKWLSPEEARKIARLYGVPERKIPAVLRSKDAPREEIEVPDLAEFDPVLFSRLFYDPEYQKAMHRLNLALARELDLFPKLVTQIRDLSAQYDARSEVRGDTSKKKKEEPLKTLEDWKKYLAVKYVDILDRERRVAKRDYVQVARIKEYEQKILEISLGYWGEIELESWLNELLGPKLSDDEPGVRFEAAHVMGGLGKSVETLDLLIKAFSDVLGRFFQDRELAEAELKGLASSIGNIASKYQFPGTEKKLTDLIAQLRAKVPDLGSSPQGGASKACEYLQHAVDTMEKSFAPNAKRSEMREGKDVKETLARIYQLYKDAGYPIEADAYERKTLGLYGPTADLTSMEAVSYALDEAIRKRVEEGNDSGALKIVDAGSGKGHVALYMAHYIAKTHPDLKLAVTGIEYDNGLADAVDGLVGISNKVLVRAETEDVVRKGQVQFVQGDFNSDAMRPYFKGTDGTDGADIVYYIEMGTTRTIEFADTLTNLKHGARVIGIGANLPDKVPLTETGFFDVVKYDQYPDMTVYVKRLAPEGTGAAPGGTVKRAEIRNGSLEVNDEQLKMLQARLPIKTQENLVLILAFLFSLGTRNARNQAVELMKMDEYHADTLFQAMDEEPYMQSILANFESLAADEGLSYVPEDDAIFQRSGKLLTFLKSPYELRDVILADAFENPNFEKDVQKIVNLASQENIHKDYSAAAAHLLAIVREVKSNRWELRAALRPSVSSRSSFFSAFKRLAMIGLVSLMPLISLATEVKTPFTRAEIMEQETYLSTHGTPPYYQGKIDGIAGPQWVHALRKFDGLPMGDSVGPKTIEAGRRVLAEEAKRATNQGTPNVDAGSNTILIQKEFVPVASSPKEEISIIRMFENIFSSSASDKRQAVMSKKLSLSDEKLVRSLGLANHWRAFLRLSDGFDRYGVLIWPEARKADLIRMGMAIQSLNLTADSIEKLAQGTQYDLDAYRMSVKVTESGKWILQKNQAGGPAATDEMIEPRSAIDAILYAKAFPKNANLQRVLLEGLSSDQANLIKKLAGQGANNPKNQATTKQLLQDGDFQNRVIMLYLYQRLESNHLVLPSAQNYEQGAGTYHIAWAPGIFEYSRTLAMFLYGSRAYDLLDKISHGETVSENDIKSFRQVDDLSTRIESICTNMRRAYDRQRKGDTTGFVKNEMGRAAGKLAELKGISRKYDSVPHLELFINAISDEVGKRMERLKVGLPLQDKRDLPSKSMIQARAAQMLQGAQPGVVMLGAVSRSRSEMRISGDDHGMMPIDDLATWDLARVAATGRMERYFTGFTEAPQILIANLESWLETHARNEKVDALEEALAQADAAGHRKVALYYQPFDNGYLKYHEGLHLAMFNRRLQEGNKDVEAQRLKQMEDLIPELMLDRRRGNEEMIAAFYEVKQALGRYIEGTNRSEELFAWVASVAEYPDFFDHLKQKATTPEEQIFLGHYLDPTTSSAVVMLAPIQRFLRAMQEVPSVKKFFLNYYQELLDAVPSSGLKIPTLTLRSEVRTVAVEQDLFGVSELEYSAGVYPNNGDEDVLKTNLNELMGFTRSILKDIDANASGLLHDGAIRILQVGPSSGTATVAVLNRLVRAAGVRSITMDAIELDSSASANTSRNIELFLTQMAKDRGLSWKYDAEQGKFLFWAGTLEGEISVLNRDFIQPRDVIQAPGFLKGFTGEKGYDLAFFDSPRVVPQDDFAQVGVKKSVLIPRGDYASITEGMAARLNVGGRALIGGFPREAGFLDLKYLRANGFTFDFSSARNEDKKVVPGRVLHVITRSPATKTPAGERSEVRRTKPDQRPQTIDRSKNRSELRLTDAPLRLAVKELTATQVVAMVEKTNPDAVRAEMERMGQKWIAFEKAEFDKREVEWEKQFSLTDVPQLLMKFFGQQFVMTDVIASEIAARAMTNGVETRFVDGKAMLDHGAIAMDLSMLEGVIASLIAQSRERFAFMINNPEDDSEAVLGALAKLDASRVMVLSEKGRQKPLGLAWRSELRAPVTPVSYVKDAQGAAARAFKGSDDPVFSMWTENLGVKLGYSVRAEIRTIVDRGLKELTLDIAVTAILIFRNLSKEEQQKVLSNPAEIRKYLEQYGIMSNVKVGKDGQLFVDTESLMNAYLERQSIDHAA